ATSTPSNMLPGSATKDWHPCPPSGLTSPLTRTEGAPDQLDLEVRVHPEAARQPVGRLLFRPERIVLPVRQLLHDAHEHLPDVRAGIHDVGRRGQAAPEIPDHPPWRLTIENPAMRRDAEVRLPPVAVRRPGPHRASRHGAAHE